MIGIIGSRGYWGSKIRRALMELGVTSFIECDIRGDDIPTREELFDFADSVIIATPADTHFDIAVKCLQAGKHIFVEKPMTTSASQAQELVNLAKKNKVKLMVGHTFLYSPYLEFIKSHLCALGTIRYMYSRRANLGIVRQDTDVLWTLGPHDVSIGMHILGKTPDSVSCTRFKLLGGQADVALLQLRYGDIHQISHLSWLDPRKSREWVIVGDKAMLVWDDVTPPHIQVYQHHIDCPEGPDFASFQAHTRPGPMVAPVVPTWEPLKRELEHFLECVREDKTPLSDGQSGLDVVSVLDTAQDSADRRGAWQKTSGNN